MSALQGCRLFVVEDEYVLVRQMTRTLEREGAQVVGCAATVAAALDQLSKVDAIDFAILDVNLAGEKVYPVAAELMRRNIGFIFLSGYDLEDRDPRFATAPQLSKPLTMLALIGALSASIARRPNIT